MGDVEGVEREQRGGKGGVVQSYEWGEAVSGDVGRGGGEGWGIDFCGVHFEGSGRMEEGTARGGEEEGVDC